MVPNIMISKEVFDRLAARAVPFVDRQPEDVIRRLLDETDSDRPAEAPTTSMSSLDRGRVQSRGSARERLPRERGVSVELEGHRIDAVSVRDLYSQSLRILVENCPSTLQNVVPFRTSSQRYLIATDPIHPTGKPFVMPVEYKGYAMEAHKDYKNAVAHMERLARAMGLSFDYLGL